MPIEPKKTAEGGPGNNAGRTNFRPPWVKEGPKPIPMPTAPWTLNKRGSVVKENEGPPPDAPTGRKSSTIKIVPAQPAENGTTSNTKDPHVFERPKLREVPKTPPKEQKLQSREVKVPISMTSTRRDSKDLPQKVHIDTKKKEENPHKVELKPVSKDEPKKKEEQIPKVELKPVKIKETDKDGPLDKVVPSERNKIVRQESMKKVCPAPPPMPPMPPPPPPPQIPFEKRESLTRSQLEKLDSLRSRPRKRPDWGAMMKDIENGKKLKKVQCNDRSQPLLPQNKAKGQFIYESEKANLHNQLLKQIQTGAQLKHVKTNDRSKPILEGLRKFRRQMTIEEKIIKSMSMASMPPEEVEEEVDEMDDIDKVRDDLQSTKQMLALELRNKEAQIAENKRLLARLANLEAELEKFKNAPAPINQKESTPTPVSPLIPGDDKLVKTLKNEAEEARKTAEQMEKKYHQTADELFTVKNDLDEVKKQNALLERKLQQTLQGGGSKRQSICDRRESVKQDEDEFSEEEESESEDDGEDNEEKQKRRAEREVRLIRNKLKSIKNKEEAAKRERKNLREMMKKNQQAMKEEKKKYKKLQKEVNKMASLMKDEEDEDDEEKEDVDEEEEETETEESETESESESSEEESESESEEEDASNADKKENLNARIKHHENSLNVVKKGNYMLKANVDRLQDDLNKQKEMVQSLQEDLDSVLAELG